MYCVTVNLNVNHSEKYMYGFCVQQWRFCKTLRPGLVDQPGELQVNNILGIANPGGVKGIQTYSGEGSSQTVVV